MGCAKPSTLLIKKIQKQKHRISSLTEKQANLQKQLEIQLNEYKNLIQQIHQQSDIDLNQIDKNYDAYLQNMESQLYMLSDQLECPQYQGLNIQERQLNGENRQNNENNENFENQQNIENLNYQDKDKTISLSNIATPRQPDAQQQHQFNNKNNENKNQPKLKQNNKVIQQINGKKQQNNDWSQLLQSQDGNTNVNQNNQNKFAGSEISSNIEQNIRGMGKNNLQSGFSRQINQKNQIKTAN
ncbi:hypothetical protein PPERSA_07033 [Pseudocohnilembus persalinus]|uniref:Uncharacterized protein n=1 Tax=Pseudocohnilembus persalinus TaxID=266149 RepID=A0A0V0QMM8_PSEPJ|nr:hypothetical protein PPERSA_07033 [Pseudocohnilembus persalinus]|eukprot:KRX03205.1 hypothetical protein PPERSA_07033 [Pseudocohnilembus persalinus]